MPEHLSEGSSPSRPRVFLSYSHDDDHHRRRALNLANLLRHHGIDAKIDRFFEVPPPKSWPIWMHEQIEAADYILVICTETYRRRLLDQEKPGIGKGAHWEGGIITQETYDHDNAKFIPIIFEAQHAAFIPYFLKPTTYYLITEDGDCLEPLLRHLYNEPEIIPAEIGSRPSFNVTTAETVSCDLDDTAPNKKKAEQIYADNAPTIDPYAEPSSREGLQESALYAVGEWSHVSDISMASSILLHPFHFRSTEPPDMNTALLRLRSALDFFANALSRIVGAPCRVTVYGLKSDQDGHNSANFLSTSSSVHEVPRPRDVIDVDKNGRLYQCLAGYREWGIGPPELESEFSEVSANLGEHHSVCVLPIQLRMHGEISKVTGTLAPYWQHLVGLLLIQSSLEDVFDASRDVAIAQLFAGLVYVYLSEIQLRVDEKQIE